MKKIILIMLSLLAVSLLIVGCQEDLTPEEQEIFEGLEELEGDKALAGQAVYDTTKLNLCRNTEGCWNKFYTDCYKVKCYGTYPSRSTAWGDCVNNCLDEALKEEVQDCDTTGTLLEGETNDYTSNGITYEITVNNFLYQDYAGGVHSVEFTVNGETFTLLEGESYTLADGGTITLTEMLYQNYAGGVHSATFCLNGGTLQCDTSETLLEGETNDYTANGVAYQVTVSNFVYQDYAGGVHSVDFDVNGEEFTLLEGESYTLADGGVITLTEILYQNYAGGVHSATFCLNGGTPTCDTSDTLLEGETNDYTANGIAYEVTVGDFLYQDYAGGVHSVEFTVNGETFTLLEGETYTLADSGTITLTEMLYQNYAGGVHSATFCLNGGTSQCDESFTLLEGESYDLSEGGTITLTDMLYQDYAGGVHSATLCVNK